MNQTKAPKGFLINSNGNIQKIPHTTLSKHRCREEGCGTRIKERLVQIKASVPRYCYKCWCKLHNK